VKYKIPRIPIRHRFALSSTGINGAILNHQSPDFRSWLVIGGIVNFYGIIGRGVTSNACAESIAGMMICVLDLCRHSFACQPPKKQATQNMSTSSVRMEKQGR
jgi:hypothetical protein